MPDVVRQRARALLAAARRRVHWGWTQHTEARRADGSPCRPESPDATCFCLSGALNAIPVLPAVYASAVRALLIQIAPEEGPLFEWNDRPGRTQAEVLALLDRAITALEESVAE